MKTIDCSEFSIGFDAIIRDDRLAKESSLRVTGSTPCRPWCPYGQAQKMAHRKPLHDSKARNILGPGIRRVREGKGWSQDDLARRLQLAGWDVDRTLIARIELRTRCITDMELIALAETFGVSLNAFKTD